MRKLLVLLALGALAAGAAIPAAADSGKHRGHGHHSSCGKVRGGYETILDGSRECFKRWRYAGGASMTLQRDGTVRSGPGASGLGVLWYAARPYGDFSLKLEFRDDAPEEGARANAGVQVRFPAPNPTVPGCPMTFDGNPITDAGAPAWIAVNCGHEIQINDNAEGDARKTGSIYGFKDLDIAAARPVAKGTWSELEIRVEGQTYRVLARRRADQRVRERARRLHGGPPERPAVGGARAGRLHRPAGARRRERRRVVPQRPHQRTSTS